MSGQAVDAARVIADLRELARRTSDERGAQRLAWGETWRKAREFFGELVAELGLEHERDQAGNLWVQLEGADANAPALALGSHLDSVPDGGWLDGALGVMAALGVLRAWAADGPPPRPLVLVDWADEEGARFGRSLLGSSAFSGSLDPAELPHLRDADSRTAVDVLAENGVEAEAMAACARRREGLGAYLELHIEQGPVLEAERLAVAAVAGCVGIERLRFRFRGQAAHAGTTPMDRRADAGLAAAEAALAVERIAGEHGGVGTTGALALHPGIATAVAGAAELTCDLRHADDEALGRMFAAARDAATEVAGARGCRMVEEQIWRIEPTRFDAELVAAATEIAAVTGGRAKPLTSGALHDAAEVARVLPAAMIFCPSIAGLSHTAEEDTAEADLTLAIEAFGGLAASVLEQDR